MPITASIRETFEKQGFVSGITICDTEGADRIRRQFDALEAEEGRERCQIGLLDRHYERRFVWELATHAQILDAVEAVIGPEILLLATHFFCKYPEAGVRRQASGVRRQEPASSEQSVADGTGRGALPTEKFVAWHQDVTYWGLEPPFAVTAWVAVDDSDAENGCMRVIPGTHAGGIRPHGTAAREGNLLSINQEVPVTPEEEARAVDLPLKAGQISLHHGALIHGSNPNRSTRRRCGLTLRYIPTSVKQITGNSYGKRYQALLVRGEDRYGYWEPRERPSW